MALHIEVIWNDITSDLPKDAVDKWWTQLLKNYSDDGRAYHNVAYLQETFDRFEMIKDKLENSKAVAFALFFHYFEYDPKAVDCAERNVDHFNKFATEASIPNETPLRTKVINLLQAATTHSTDEHKTEGAYGNEDRHYFLDIDIADLGSSAEDYAEYTAKIQKEYDFLPGSMYKNLRLKVLESFLQIPNIYATKEFRDKYENQARNNIQEELKILKT